MFLPFPRLNNGDELYKCSHLGKDELTPTESNKVSSLYNPVADTCEILHTRRGLVNAVAMLVIDVVLLVSMLIGLLRHVYSKSGSMWKLLYQQVTFRTFSQPYA